MPKKKISRRKSPAAKSKFRKLKLEKLSRRQIHRNWKLISIALSLCFFAALSVYFFWDLPNPKNLTSRPAPASTRLLDRHGALIYEIFETERRTPVRLSTLPKHLIDATLAAEDKDFYSHSGFSLRGITRAFLNTFFKRNLQGGSTITQQLVKKALLSDERTLRRKVREFALSSLVELLYTKDEILELYLNQVPYGGTAYGIEAAALTYFGKTAAILSLTESALLAGLPQAPSYYSPFGAHPELAQDRKNYVLRQMLDNRMISESDYASASAQVLTFSPPTTLRAPHFSLWVKDLLANEYGLHTVEQEGLTVITTLDLELQEFAQNTVATETAKLQKEKVGNGAVLITLPRTGEILGLVGSRDYYDSLNDGAVNVVLARRQPGSSIKPVNYALAFERRLLTPGTLLNDKPTCFAIPNQKNYCPDNYDNQFHGPTQVRFALGNSFNIPAVKTLVLNGLSDFVASSSAFGLTTFTDPKNYGPSLTLGGGEVTMYDMATAYAVFANTGRRVDLNPILQIIDRSGKILESANLKALSPSEAEKAAPHELITINSKPYVSTPPPDTRVISAETAFLISHILYDNGARSATFGSSSFLNIKGHPEVSVKTGTTNDKRDNWTIGYNPDILVAVWVGNNDNTPLSRIASGVTGAAPIWNKVTTQALKNYKQNWPTQPAGVTGTLICSLSGLKAPENPDPGSCPTRYEYFLSGTTPPIQAENLRRDIAIFKPTQSPATPGQITQFPGDIETQNHSVIYDALGTALCLDCAGGYGDADIIRLDSTGRAAR